MAEQRPIVYFQRLMGNYDRQVAEIMKAKREYLVFAEDEVIVPVVKVEREPVKVEVLTPTPVPTQLKPKKIVELNAPLNDKELVVQAVEEQPVDQPVIDISNLVHPKEQVQEAEVVVTQVEKAPEEPVAVKAVSSTMPEPEPKVVEKKAVEETPKPKPMTGLGLNLDSIFNEEFSAEQTGYFGK